MFVSAQRSDLRRRSIEASTASSSDAGCWQSKIQPVEHRVKHNDSLYDPDAALARVDAIAAATLSSKLLERYEAYEQVLLVREQDHAAIVATLALLVSAPSEGSDRSAAISCRGTGT